MADVNRYGDISPRTAAKAIKQLLPRAARIMVTEKIGQPYVLGANNTKTAVFRRYEHILPPTSPLSEGVPPKGKELKYTDYAVPLEQEGDIIKITDVVADTHEDPILQQCSDIITDQAALTFELRRIEKLKAGTNVYYTEGTSGRTGVAKPITRGVIREAVRVLKRNWAVFISSMISASPKFGTVPVAQAFFAYGHTDLEPDLKAMDGFEPIEKYGNPNDAVEGEVGKIENTRFILTPNFTPWLGAGAASTGKNVLATNDKADIYPVIICAKNCFGTVPLRGGNNMNLFVLNPNQPSKSDPLGQMGSVGWKGWQASLILNDAWIARLECACTAALS